MGPISSGGMPYHDVTSHPTRQEEEIKQALKVLTEAAEEASVGGTISAKLFEKCKESLSAIANDPKMPQHTRAEAQKVLQEFENSPGKPNANEILNNIAQTVEKMKA